MIRDLIKKPSSKITVRKTTALPKKRAEIESLLTKEGVERFLNEMGRGALEASVVTFTETAKETSTEASTETSTDNSTENPPDVKLGLGDTVTVKLVALEFAGLTGLAQMLVAAKAPKRVKPMIESTPVFEKVGAGLDLAYGLLRGGLTFSSKVTEWNSDADALTYVDEGIQLPKPLTSWKHTHRVTDSDEGGMIIDELTVEVDPAIAAPVVESALRLHLDSRAKAYKKVFEA
jgi:ligand-binding SRPBCC domain-containing protein